MAVALTASSLLLMPLLGWAKLRLGQRLGSGATAGEGVQNLLCAGQAAAALVAVIGAGAGLTWLDPVAALLIAGVALKEGVELWRGEDSCCATPGLELRAGDACLTTAACTTETSHGPRPPRARSRPLARRLRQR